VTKIQNIKSFGYIQKFASRNISLHKIYSKAGSVAQEKADNWMFNDL